MPDSFEPMAPSPNVTAPSANSFWTNFKSQTLAGVAVAAIGAIGCGIGYLVFVVPSRLDRVLSNQGEFKGRLDKVEQIVDNQGDRLIRLEAKP